MSETTAGTLEPGEPHPAAHRAMAWVRGRHDIAKLAGLVEVFASAALSGDRMAEVCGETLHRLMAGEPVSDRYLLGLAWVMRDIEGAPEGRA